MGIPANKSLVTMSCSTRINAETCPWDSDRDCLLGRIIRDIEKLTNEMANYYSNFL